MRKLLSLLIALLLITFAAFSLAEEAPFSVELLKEYTTITWNKLIGTQLDDETEDNWSYFTAYDLSDFLFDGFAPDSFTLYIGVDGISSVNGIPIILLLGNSGQKISIIKMDILVGNRVYRIDASKIPSFYTGEKNNDGTYKFASYFRLGLESVNLFSDIYAQEGNFTLRAYYGKSEHFDISPARKTIQYSRYYEGLLYSHFYDSKGNVSPAVERMLRNNEKKNNIAKVTVVDRSDKVWSVVTPAPTPLAQLNDSATSQYETLTVGHRSDHLLKIRMRMYELGYFAKVPTQTEFTNGMVEYVNAFQMQNGLPIEKSISPEMQALLFSEHALSKATATPRPTATPKPTPTPYVEPAVILQQSGKGDWARSNGVPWFSTEIKNISKTKTVTKVAVLYHCEDENGEQIINANTGETDTVVWLDATIRPGRSKMMPKIRTEGYENVKSARCTLYAYQLEDGTVVIIPEREHLYWLCKF